MRITSDARISMVLLAVSLLALAAFFRFGFRSLPARQRVRQTALSRAAEDAGTRFRDITASVGLSSVGHDTGGVHSILDVIAPGVALLDLDLDKDLDLVVLRGPNATPSIGVFLNRIRERRELWFEDVTRDVGVTWQGAAQGICAGDYDNDKDVDLFVTALGGNLLLRNLLQEEGVLLFRDVTDEAKLVGGEYHFIPGPEGRPGRIQSGPVPVALAPSDRPLNEVQEPVPEFSTGASFGDFDMDGYLDLYVANYLSYHPGLVPEADARADRGEPVEYQPRPYPAQADRLYRNMRDGTFRDVTLEVQIQNTAGKGLAVRFLHLVDRQQSIDRKPDIYVANDASANQLFVNMSGRDVTSFAEMGIPMGVADVRSGMGLASGDPDGDGDLDLVVTNWRFEPASLFVGISNPRRPDLAHFEDQSQSFGLAGPTERYVGWGAVLFDYDLDGYQDLALANGFTSPEGASLTCSPEPLQLLRNLKGHRFLDVSNSAGAPFQEKYNGRGLVTGDLDLDGDLDLVLVQNNGPLVILANQLTRPQGRLFTFDQALDNNPRAEAIGTRLVVQVGANSQMQTVESGSSYLSQGPMQLYFGVGVNQWLDRVRLYSAHPAVQDQPFEQVPVTTWRLD